MSPSPSTFSHFRLKGGPFLITVPAGLIISWANLLMTLGRGPVPWAVSQPQGTCRGVLLRSCVKECEWPLRPLGEWAPEPSGSPMSYWHSPISDGWLLLCPWVVSVRPCLPRSPWYLALAGPCHFHSTKQVALSALTLKNTSSFPFHKSNRNFRKYKKGENHL